mmetsp:Transcript_19210/g.30126  ORF Transcript_19210/g.30126 Transcript_19210/m.30126 type:complete len:282 (+) Transcript_19210:94-939(+)
MDKCLTLLVIMCSLLYLANGFGPGSRMASKKTNHCQLQRPAVFRTAQTLPKLHASSQEEEITSEAYTNKLTEFLGLFIKKQKKQENLVIDSIDWDKKKRRRSSLEKLAADIKPALIEKEWFVTGNVDPSYFSANFEFEDPDVKLSGTKEYAIGVNKLFDQETARAETIDCVVNSTVPDTITVTWRLSGKVSIGPGLEIKPYIVFTDFTVSPEDGLIVSQLDRFSLPGSDILLSALFPFLRPFLAPPAPSAEQLIEASLAEKKKKATNGSAQAKKGLGGGWW